MPDAPLVPPLRASRLARLDDARLYLCTDARERTGDLAAFADAALRGGVDVIQLRQKGMEARAEIAAVEVLAEAARRHGALVAVNDRADVAAAVGPDVLHLGQDDLPVAVARRILGEDVLLGRSCHDEAQAATGATEPGIDYFCTGPCWTDADQAGPSRRRAWTWCAAPPRRAPAGPGSRSAGSTWRGCRRCWPRGPRRVVVVRAITEADDPEAAARAFATALRAQQP